MEDFFEELEKYEQEQLERQKRQKRQKMKAKQERQKFLKRKSDENAVKLEVAERIHKANPKRYHNDYIDGCEQEMRGWGEELAISPIEADRQTARAMINQYEQTLIRLVAFESGEKPQRNDKKCFDCAKSQKELSNVFDTLKIGGYLDKDSDLQCWLWVCTGRIGNQPAKPLKWHGTPSDLAVMIHCVFGAKWKVAENWFLYVGKDGELTSPKPKYLSKRYNGTKAENTNIWKILNPKSDG